MHNYVVAIIPTNAKVLLVWEYWSIFLGMARFRMKLFTTSIKNTPTVEAAFLEYVNYFLCSEPRYVLYSLLRPVFPNA